MITIAKDMATKKNQAVTDYGLVRVAAVVPQVNVADVDGNLAHMIESIDKAVKAQLTWWHCPSCASRDIPVPTCSATNCCSMPPSRHLSHCVSTIKRPLS